MSWVDILLLASTSFLIGSWLAMIRSYQKLNQAQRDLIEALEGLHEAGVLMLNEATQVVHCLVYRLSPRGHIDLTEEEWQEAERGSVEVFRHKDGTIRILAK